MQLARGLGLRGKRIDEARVGNAEHGDDAVLIRFAAQVGDADTLTKLWRDTRAVVRPLHERLYYRPILAAAARLTTDQAKLSPQAAKERLKALGYQDPDGADKQAWHLLGYDAGGALVASLRVVDPGVKYPEPSIGRVVTAPLARGNGMGHALVQEGLVRCHAAWPGQAVRISAQAHLQGFYGRLGFIAVSGQYLEDDIPHIEMLWSPP